MSELIFKPIICERENLSALHLKKIFGGFFVSFVCVTIFFYIFYFYLMTKYCLLTFQLVLRLNILNDYRHLNSIFVFWGNRGSQRPVRRFQTL